jgi:hypothetical protein
MFTAKENKLDLLDALQTGKIVLVNTSAKRLQEASAVFGRYIIALTLSAAFERLLLGGEQKRAYLVLDEAHEYFDEQVEKILVQARKCELGLVYATQLLEQMDPYLRAVAATATTIKFARGVSDRNARELAPDMKTSAEFISSTTKTGEGAYWAAYVRELTTSGAISLFLPFGSLESQPKMSESAWRQMRANNRCKYGAAPESAPTAHAPAASERPQQIAPQRQSIKRPIPTALDADDAVHTKPKPRKK